MSTIYDQYTPEEAPYPRTPKNGKIGKITYFPTYEEEEYNRRYFGEPEGSLPGPVPPENPPHINVGGQQYPISLPQRDPNYVWVTNRDNLIGNWYRNGSSIYRNMVGHATFKQIGRDSVFGPEHHGRNIGAEVAMSDDKLRENLRRWGIPTEGNRAELLKRNIRVKTSELYQRLEEGGRPSSQDIYNIVYNPDRNPSLAEANQLRQLRQEAGIYDRVATAAGPAQQVPRKWTGGTGRPSGNPLSAAEQTATQNWGQSNLQRAAAAQSTPRPSALGTGRNPMTIGALESQAEAQAAQTAATEAAGTSALSTGLGTAGMFAARAMPVLNVAMMGGMLYNIMQSQNQAKKEEERRKNMRI